MKTLSTIFANMLFMYLLFGFLACKKETILQDANMFEGKKTPTETSNLTIDNLGKPFASTNVNYLINPLNPNNSPLFVYNANSTSGYELVMVDNGKTDGQTPLNAFRFITVNLIANSYKVVTIKDKNTGTEVTNSVGRIVRYVFGKNKKLYVATEGSYGGGGHIIEYDFYTQSAIDLGKPFLKGNAYLDIYSLNIATDGTLCGGSFGGSGDVMTFRYNYNFQFDVDAVSLDNTSRYVAYISGDDKYTYASCGENNWYLYAIDKTTKQKTLLLQQIGSNNRIELMTRTDAPYAKLINTHYLLQSNTITSLGAYNLPPTNQLVYTVYQAANTTLPTVSWKDYNKTLSYTLPSGQTGSLVINEAATDYYPTGAAVWLNNQLYLASTNHSLFGTYNRVWNILGTTGIDIYSVAANADNSGIYIGGYPKGKLLQYNYSQPWTLNLNTNSDPFVGTKTFTNPMAMAMLQDADNSGNHGPIGVTQMVTTKSGILVAAGDNDRITNTSGRQLAISTFKAGVVANCGFSGLSSFQFSSMCLNNDSTLVYIAGYPIAGGQAVIFVYNPTTNAIVNTLPFSGTNAGKIINLNATTIAGCYDDVVYTLNSLNGAITWQQTLGSGQRIYSIAKANSTTFFINHLYLQATHFKVVKYSITQSTSISAASTTIAEFDDADFDESTKPTSLLLTPSNGGGVSDLYITGLKAAYRIKNVGKF